MRNSGFEISFRQSVSELEEVARLNNVSLTWDADAVAYVNLLIEQEKVQGPNPFFALVSASRQTSPAVVRSVLDNVRTRVLDVALALERVQPDAGEPGAAPADLSTVNNIVNIIYGH